MTTPNACLLVTAIAIGTAQFLLAYIAYTIGSPVLTVINAASGFIGHSMALPVLFIGQVRPGLAWAAIIMSAFVLVIFVFLLADFLVRHGMQMIDSIVRMAKFAGTVCYTMLPLRQSGGHARVV